MTARDFGQVINHLRFGELTEELSYKMQTLVLICQETGKVGEITLSLKIKPGKAGQMEILDTIKIKRPEPEKGTTILFSTPEGHLQREDPRQMQIDGLKSIDASRGELRTVA